MKTYNVFNNIKLVNPICHKEYMELYNDLKKKEGYFNQTMYCSKCDKHVNMTNMSKHRKSTKHINKCK